MQKDTQTEYRLTPEEVKTAIQLYILHETGHEIKPKDIHLIPDLNNFDLPVSAKATAYFNS